ncbi:MAG: helix-turn-helix domain-containing protein [Bacteroidetes bacterium]|jgi:AraC-like DNA-binding protein|nr:helix-turn-helix domain-containing protein [Bacteroidota bacterium]
MDLTQTYRRLEREYPPQRLVENRTAFGGEDLRLSVYDTVAQASRVALRSSYPTYCGMITGRKDIHLPDSEAEPFAFLPGESLVLPPLETILIDFPNADDEPTKCITLEIDTSKVSKIVARLNEQMPRSEASGPWTYDRLTYCHFQNSDGLNRVVDSIVQLFTEPVPHRDMLIDLNASEMIIRMLQTESRMWLMGNYTKHAPSNGLAAAVQYAKNNLDDETLTVGDLADQACMSRSSFHRYFRNEFGMTPLQYVTQERITHAKNLLRDSRRSVGDAAARVGFSSVSHFIKVFKSHVGTTPKQFQLNPPEEAAGALAEALL